MKVSLLTLLLAAALFVSTTASAAGAPANTPPNKPGAGLSIVQVQGSTSSAPLSPAVAAGGMIYVSGQLGFPKGGGPMPDNLTDQTRLALENIRTILDAAGSGMDKVVTVTVYMKDISQIQAMNKVYASFFTKHFPARATVEVARLVQDALIEISVVAVQ